MREYSLITNHKAIMKIEQIAIFKIETSSFVIIFIYIYIYIIGLWSQGGARHCSFFFPALSVGLLEQLL